MKILGIETSCDETAASVIEGGKKKIKVLSNVVSSQIDIHKKYGGVVPEVAAREHVMVMLPVIHEALAKAGIKEEDVKNEITALSVTVGPGLVTSLLAGVETAKTLSYAWDLSVVAVNHIEGHIYANYIGEFLNSTISQFPNLILTVSGGHTILALMEAHGKFKIIGETRDDAAGEAFDKAAKMLGIGYPGGPVISAEAEKITNKQCLMTGDIKLPRPMMNSLDFDFSFSGLKTAIRYAIESDEDYKKRIPEYCYEFQQAVIDVLVLKTIKAAKKYNIKTVMLAGGVSANIELRKQLKKVVEENGINFSMPDLRYTTDNAVMIACAGYFKAQRKEFTNWRELRVDCGLEL